MDVVGRVTDSPKSPEGEPSPLNTESVERVCMFVGYPRSGHSVVGAILDAHPYAVVSHELDILAHWERGVGWPELTSLIGQNSREAARKGRRQSGYGYSLPGQGTSGEAKVVGDKKGGRTAHYLTLQPDILERFQEATPWPIHLIHVIRDPRDNVATMSRLHDLSPTKALDSYRVRARAVQRLKQSWPGERFFDVYFEELLESPREQLVRLLDFRNLEPNEQHLRDSCELLFHKPRLTRAGFEWDGALRELEAMCCEIAHLGRYQAL